MVRRPKDNTLRSYTTLYRNMLSQSYVDQLERDTILYVTCVCTLMVFN